MDSGNRQRNQQITQLAHQQLQERIAQLDQEVRAQLALANIQQLENARSYLNEINVWDRAMLEACHREALDQLAHQNRLARIALLKRHAQQKTALAQLSD